MNYILIVCYTTKYNTQNRKSLGFAEASLTFDNSDGKLPIEYSEVKVTRRIYQIN